MKKAYIILIIFILCCVGTLIYFYKNECKTIPVNKEVTFNDSKAERLYKEAVEGALTKEIKSYVSGLTFRMYVPNGYHASTTKEVIYEYKELGAIDVVKIYKTNIEDFDPIITVFALPYSNIDNFIESEPIRHTSKSTNHASKYFVTHSDVNNSWFRITAKEISNDEGGDGNDSYYVYTFPKFETRDKVLIVNTNIDTTSAPAEMQKETQAFFNIINEMSVW